MDDIKKSLQTLQDAIYVTRKCRINSAERLKNWDCIIAWINTYYTAFLIVLSVIAISSSSEQSFNVNLYIISSSVLALAFNTLSMTWQFKDRYYAFKENYIKLHSLYLEVSTLQQNSTITKQQVLEYQNRYNELLNTCENHTSQDYYQTLKNDKTLYSKKVVNSSSNPVPFQVQMTTFNFHLRYLGTKFLKIIYILVMIIAPFILPLLIQQLAFFING